MSGVRNIALGLGAWLLVVTGGAVLVWTVISQAGQGVAGPPPVVGSQQQEGRPSDRPSGKTPDPSTSASGSSSATASATASATPSATAAPAVVRGTWQGQGGVVIAECRASAVGLVAAQASSGWRVEVDDRGPDRVRVEFEAGDEGARVRVEAGCGGGAPVFSVETDDD